MKIKAELTFPGQLKDEAILCYICKKFDIILNIVEASFSTNTGWAILIFDGSEEELKATFEYIKEKGVKIEEIQRII